MTCNRGGGIMWAFGDGLMMLFIVAVTIAYITHAAGNATAGNWLEGVRRSTLAANLRCHRGARRPGFGDLDDDDAALAAYNRMLSRLSDEDVSRSGSSDAKPGWLPRIHGIESQGTGLLHVMPLQGEYEPSPSRWARDQVEEYESSGGTRGTSLHGRPVVDPDHSWREDRTSAQDTADAGRARGQVRRRGLAWAERPKNPVWYHNVPQPSACRAPGRSGAPGHDRARGHR